LRVARVLKYSKLRQLKDLLMLKNEELRKMAITDGLSQLYNRRYFLELLEREFPRSQRYKLNLSCIMTDLDHFKNVNDQYGHLQGDYVIQRMGTIIKEEIREIDIPARYGGEEFIILLPETDEKGTIAVAERLRKRTAAENFTRNEKLRQTQELHITISLGVAVFPHPTLIHPNDLIKTADDALYTAKRGGRNKTILADFSEESIEIAD
ncbi:MAG: GGDEF domain-containing protein, partial [FCB group bacterium]|nr:GGDEF domain-containing protein [FCB group bacterium]